MKKTKVAIVLVIMFTLLTVFSSGCFSAKEYKITVNSSITNGTVTVDKVKAKEGTTIVMTITPDINYQLKAGSLKFNGTAISEDTKTFIMPGKNVTITAEFEEMLLEQMIIGRWTNGVVDLEFTASTATSYELSGEVIQSHAWSTTGNTIVFEDTSPFLNVAIVGNTLTFSLQGVEATFTRIA